MIAFDDAAVEAFVRTFFGPPNQLRLDNLGTEALKALEPFLEDLAQGRQRAYLPRRGPNAVEWYAISRSARDVQVLREELLAFVGPSYSNFHGEFAQLDPADPIDAAVHQFAGAGRVFRLGVVDPRLKDHVRDALMQLRSLSRERPTRSPERVRPTGRVLRDFELALRAGNFSGARAFRDELARQGRVDARNLLFLEVRTFETEQAWAQILDHQAIGTLLGVRRPRLVTQALIRAVYACELQRFETEGKPAAAIDHFRQVVHPLYATLFQTKAAMSAPEVDKSFLMLAAIQDPPGTERRDEILRKYPVEASDRAWIEALARLVPDRAVEEAVGSLVARAQTLFAHGRVDQAFELLREAPRDLPSLGLLLTSAHLIDTLEAAQVAIDAVEQAPADVQNAMIEQAMLRKIWEQLLGHREEEGVAEPLPSSWPVWFERLRVRGAWNGALRLAEKGSEEWDVRDLAREPAEISRMAELLLAQHDTNATELLRNSLPFLLRAFLPQGKPARVFMPLYEALMIFLATDDECSTDHMTLLSDLFEARLAIGMSESEYARMIGDVIAAWDHADSPQLIDWSLDTLDMLLGQPSPDPAARLRFLFRAGTGMKRHWSRVDRGQILLFQVLSEELGQEMPEEFAARLQEVGRELVAGEQGLSGLLVGRSVALYSLDEGALRRTAATLEALAPGVRVSTFSDKVGGSNALRQQARTVDIFIIATRAATHAATGFIGNNRPVDAVTLYPPGKGSASMLRTIENHILRSVQ